MKISCHTSDNLHIRKYVWSQHVVQLYGYNVLMSNEYIVMSTSQTTFGHRRGQDWLFSMYELTSRKT